jgi:hypothetical protein
MKQELSEVFNGVRFHRNEALEYPSATGAVGTDTPKPAFAVSRPDARLDGTSPLRAFLAIATALLFPARGMRVGRIREERRGASIGIPKGMSEP